MNGNDTDRLWQKLDALDNKVDSISSNLSTFLGQMVDYADVKKAAYEGRTIAKELKEDFKALCTQFWGIVAGIILLALAVVRDWLGAGP